jgi:hypothetical protein
MGFLAILGLSALHNGTPVSEIAKKVERGFDWDEQLRREIVSPKDDIENEF